MKRICSLVLSVLLSCQLFSQELEPRAYANLPKDLNALALVYGYSTGNVLTDPGNPIQGAKMHAHSVGMGYVHTFGLFKKLARVQVVAPLSFLSGTATINGHDTGAARTGFGDARIRIGINLTGSPALAAKDFVRYSQKTIIGVSLVASVPIGLYYKDKIINLGSNRWAFKPEIGVSRHFKQFYIEGYTGLWFYTKNTAYQGNKVQSQDPVFSIQAHTSWSFKNQMWIGLNLNWFNGGKTYVNGTSVGDLQDNWRLGATWSMPLAKMHSLKLQFHVGAFTSTGYDYNMIALGYQYVFF